MSPLPYFIHPVTTSLYDEKNLAGVIKVLEVKLQVAQSCPTLCDFMDYTVHGTLQARILEWVTYPFSSGSSQPRDQTGVSCIADRVLREAPRFLR